MADSNVWRDREALLLGEINPVQKDSDTACTAEHGRLYRYRSGGSKPDMLLEFIGETTVAPKGAQKPF